MSWLNLAWNGEDGFRKVRAEFTRVPIYGERMEFWNPDGSAAEVHDELDGNTFYVSDVTWVTRKMSSTNTVYSEPTVFLVPEADWSAVADSPRPVDRPGSARDPRDPGQSYL